MNELTRKTSPKDIFLQLLAIVTLYGSAASVLALLFQFVNIQIPDPLNYDSMENARSGIRFAVSSLIIVFPVFLWAVRFLARSYVALPERKEIRIRKWLAYFTLFAAGVIIMGDLVALVNSFLNGELTARFLLKILSVFLVAGAVFWYYYWDIKDEKPASMPLFQWAVILVVISIVVSAFFFVGSPKIQRLRQFDNQRIGDLQSIQWQIVNYWRQKGILPADLSMLEDDISGFRAPKDPVNGAPYEYELKNMLEFVLCGDFSLASELPARENSVYYPSRDMMTNWNHEAGRVCFERTVDPDLYPVRKDIRPVP